MPQIFIPVDNRRTSADVTGSLMNIGHVFRQPTRVEAAKARPRLSSCLLLASLLLLVCAAAASAGAQISPRQHRDRDEDIPGMGSPTDEMRYRAAVKHDENSHRETIERAEEAANLGAEIRTLFERNKAVGRDDLKKLERVEKLARKIRSRAGASDDEEGLKSPPNSLGMAVARLAEVSDRLHKSVKKTSRFVVSAAAIELSNEVIELARYIRANVQP